MEKLVFDIEINTKLGKAIDELEKVRQETEKTNENLTRLQKIAKASGKATKGLAKGFKGMGLAMKTMGVGLLLEGFKMLKEIIMQNQPVVDAIDVAMTSLGIVFNQVADVVNDVVTAVTSSSTGFDALGKVLKGVMTATLTPMKLSFFSIKLAIQGLMLAWEKSPLGGGDTEKIKELTASIDETKESISTVATEGLDALKDVGTNITAAVSEIVAGVEAGVEAGVKGIKEINVTAALETADALVEQRKEVELLEAGQQKLMLQYQTAAELQRQIRDDESKTFAERKAANDELSNILDEQLEKEQALSQKKLDLAILEASVNSDNLELQKLVIAAETELVDINERLTGQRSEQLTNTNALIREQADAINELRTAGLSERDAELEQLAQDYEYKVELARKSGLDTVAITSQYNALIGAANKKHGEEDAKTQELLDKKAQDRRDANVDGLGKSISMAGALFEEGTVAAKGFAIASAIMDTYKAVNMALASSPPPFSYITAGLSLAMGIKNVKEILKVNPKNPKNTPPSGGGGGGSAAKDVAIASASAVGNTNIDEASENVDELSEGGVSNFNLGASLDAFGGNNPIQAYVITQDVQEQTEISEQINQRATL